MKKDEISGDLYYYFERADSDPRVHKVTFLFVAMA